MNLTELEDRQVVIRTELERLAGDDAVTEEDDGDLRDSLIEEYEALETRKVPIVERMEKLKLIRRSTGGNIAREGGGQDDNGHSPRGPVTPEFMVRMDPFAELDKVRDRLVPPKDVIARAQNVIESHNKRGYLEASRAEEATRKAAYRPEVARHMLLTGHDDYVENFRLYLEDPMGEGQMAQRSLLLGTASGGFLLPYVLDPTIVLTSAGSTNPYRQIAEVKHTTSNAWQGVNSAGVSAGWLDENAAASDGTPTVGQIQIYVKKAASWVFGSFEVTGDTEFAAQLPSLLSDAKDVLEETAFAVGTGGAANAGQPFGIISRLGTAQRVLANGSTGAFQTGTGGIAEVYRLNSALPPRFRLSQSVGWLANITNINTIRSLDQYGGGGFWTNLQDDKPDRLLGKRISESPSITGAVTVGTALTSAALVFGDMSKFYVVDRIGSTMLFDPLVKGTGATPTGNQGWFYYWRVGSDVAAANAFRWLANGSA